MAMSCRSPSTPTPCPSSAPSGSTATPTARATRTARPCASAPRPTTQNCARCHGLEAISGGIAPDLRKLDGDCSGLADAAQKELCYAEISEYFVGTVRKGRTRDGRVYMPPFEGTLSQEAIWSIKTYLETRRAD